MKKALIGLTLAALMQGAQAQTLNTFDQITNELSNGHEITALINLKECVINDPNSIKIPLANWLVTPRAVVFTDTLIALDGEKYTHGRPPLPVNGLMQRGSIKIDNSGNSAIVLSFFDAGSSQKAMQDVTIQCQLNSGLTVFVRS